jgi:outer membrane biosynthesis protein TonB
MSESNFVRPMVRVARPAVAALALCMAGAAVLSAGTAWAGGWADYKAAFPVFPCQDGWAGCLVEGGALNAELQKDAAGMPVPAGFRVGWDLKPTSGLSPFVLLSSYAAKVAEVATEAPPEVVADAGAEANNGGDASPPEQPETKPEGQPEVKPDSKPVSDAKPADASKPKPNETKPAETKPSGTSEAKPTNDTKAADAKAVPESKPADTKTEPGTANLAVDNSCDNLVRLEPSAMLGKLTDGQIACLETAFGAAKQTDKDKISRVLMGNAYSKGDMKSWEKLIKRHLDEVDQSDPDLCYKYAQFLQKKGSYDGAIKWANVALERKTVWTGDQFTQRVSALMKIRAAAAQAKWKKLEDENAASPSPEAQTKVDGARNQTKVFAREWYEYAKQSKKDETTALQLCVSAAGTKDYCEGS